MEINLIEFNYMLYTQLSPWDKIFTEQFWKMYKVNEEKHKEKKCFPFVDFFLPEDLSSTRIRSSCFNPSLSAATCFKLSALVFSGNLRVQYVWSAQYTRKITVNIKRKIKVRIKRNKKNFGSHLSRRSLRTYKYTHSVILNY